MTLVVMHTLEVRSRLLHVVMHEPTEIKHKAEMLLQLCTRYGCTAPCLLCARAIDAETDINHVGQDICTEASAGPPHLVYCSAGWMQ